MEHLSSRVFERAAQQFVLMDSYLDSISAGCGTFVYPRSLDASGALVTSDSKWWCSGFFPGSLWLVYEYTKDENIKNLALKYTEPLSPLQYRTDDHDIGFQLMCSFWNAYCQTGNKDFLSVICNGASSLASRFNPAVGCTLSWRKGADWEFPVIIDNMMNLELLMKGYELTGTDSLRNIAISHARTTMKNHFRADNSCFHMVDYDPLSGDVRKKRTVQGFSDESAWSRGQAWALYGYTMMYRKTKEEDFLNQARAVADYIIERLPADLIPYWDFDSPSIPDDVRDASAASIIASGLIDLSRYVPRKASDRYLAIAEAILRELASDRYMFAQEEKSGFILKHSTGSKPGNSEVDVPLTYADYYFLEALLRYENRDRDLMSPPVMQDDKPAFDMSLLPSPIYDEDPGYVELYEVAWKQAYEHIKYQPGLVQPLYMDEGLWDDTIWIWDTEFMVLFCKYAPDVFPGIQSLNNFYSTMLESKASSLRIQHPDNPPFFAWVESEYYKFTNDKEHLHKLLQEQKYLQRYHMLFDELTPELKLPFEHYPMAVRRQKLGYNWNGISSGMDNTPRQRGGKDMLWLDAVSQQALSALYIARLAREVGDRKTAGEFNAKYEELKTIINENYWDEEDGCYYDIEPDGSFVKVLTPASFWPMLAEIPSQEQAKRMIEFALNEEKLGGEIPWVTVSRDDSDFDQTDGNYWRGAVWLPTSYMAIKSLEKYGFHTEACETAENVLAHMSKTYKEYEPHTIWECYSPVSPAPSSNHGQRVRPDFCGWSALGPISLFIENVLGFYEVDATSCTIRWNLHQSCRHGIRNLRFGDVVTDIVYDEDKIEVISNHPYTLFLNNRKYDIPVGAINFTILQSKRKF